MVDAEDDEEQKFIDRVRHGLTQGYFTIDALVATKDGLVAAYEGGQLFDFSPLYCAALNGWCSAADWILSHGADVNVTCLEHGSYAPLHAAAVGLYMPFVELLLNAGAPVDARDSWERTALGYIAANAGTPGYQISRDTLKMCKLLLSRDASLYARSSDGSTPVASAQRNTDVNSNTNRARMAALLAGVHAAGGWLPYVAAPRNELVEFRRQLPSLQRGPSSVPAHVERLFTDLGVPDEVFRHVLAFWRSARDY